MKKKMLPFLLMLFILITSCRLTPHPVPTMTPSATVEVTLTPTIAIMPSRFPSETPTLEATVERTESAEGELARRHVVYLSEEIGQRIAGTESELQAAQYIQSVLNNLGYEVLVQPFPFGGIEVSATPDPSSLAQGSQNVIAIKPGESTKEIIVGAHMDSVSIGSGADDNASGVGVMLEVAQHLAQVDTPYTIRFVAFGAEEPGLNGSTYYVDQMSQEEIDNTLVMINLDSLAIGDYLYVYGDQGEDGQVRDWALTYAAQNNLPLETQNGANPDYPAGTTGDWSDHFPFKQAGIPYTYFESTNWTLGNKDGYIEVDPQYGNSGEIMHSEYDTVAYFDKTFPGRMNEHLWVFSQVLTHILTEYEETP